MLLTDIMLIEEIDRSNKLEQLRRFNSWACSRLNIKNEPKVRFSDDIDEVEEKRTFGSTSSDGEIWVHVGDRTPADIMRTLCHELVHYKQFDVGLAHEDMSEEQRQSIEDVANAVAGRLLRDYGKRNVDIYY